MQGEKRIRILGAPLDLGAGRRGVDMGPSALRVAGLHRMLAYLGYHVEDRGDIEADIPETQEIGSLRMRFADSILRAAGRLYDATRQAFDDGFLPLVLGGDHSISIGTVSGSTTHFSQRGQSLGLVSLDAHADLNTPDTTPSGNVHGMCLAILLGLGDPRFTTLAGPAPKVHPANAALIGVRDLDPGEREHVQRLGLAVHTMREIDEHGLRDAMKRAIDAATNGTAGIHLQLDMDVIDPGDAPGTGTPVRGGLSYREAHLAMEILADSGAVRAIDIVEINPILDDRNRTAELGVELLLSALGKRIL